MDVKFPPPFTIRQSRRSRRISLRVLPGRRLEVILPAGWDEALAEQSLWAAKKWILKHASALGPPEKALSRFLLFGGSKAAHVCFCGGRARIFWEKELAGTVAKEQGSFPAALPDELLPIVKAQVQAWLKQEANAKLRPLLYSLAGLCGLEFARMTVRCQRSRWGSCSWQKNISLNAYLLFLPRPLIRYVLLHELCHLREMHHKDTFWQLLGEFEPEWPLLRAQMKKAWTFVPCWLLP